MVRVRTCRISWNDWADDEFEEYYEGEFDFVDDDFDLEDFLNEVV